MNPTKRDELAATWGVHTSYENYNKERQQVPPETVDAILEVMGADEKGPPPAVATIVRSDEQVALSDVVSIHTEDGGSAKPHRGGLPPDLSPGYHRAVGRDGRERPLVVTPGVCHLPDGLNAWGWALQLYSLRSEGSWGVGDLRDLASFASWTAERGGRAVMLNPLHAVLPISSQQPSPYFPSSRCFRNPIYLAVEEIAAADAVTGLDALANEGRQLNGGTIIDRDASYRVKMDVLTKAWQGRPHPEFEDYLADRGELLRSYATFAALAEHYDAGPHAWPDDLARGEPEAVEAWAVEHQDRIRFHAWLQWLLDDQLERAGERIGLVNDLAIGVDPQGADAWLWRDVFASGVTVGAPPDEFNLSGQGWGLPPFDPWKLRAAGYEPFIRTIRSAFRHSAGIRIDHVMGLFRLFWIPDGSGAERGTYVRYPHEDLLNIVALESQRAQAYVVGEDLGTVEDSVRAEMEARNMMSYRILWFEEDKPESYPNIALAAVTNHDLPTVAGLWTGSDLEAQKELGLEVNEEGVAAQLKRLRGWLELEPEADLDTVIMAIYELLVDAPSAVVMATLEDALGVQERPNVPGTTDERPNWSIALPVMLDELKEDARVLALAEMLSGRRT